MAPRVQEAQHTGFLELKECTGVREGATLGDIAGNTGWGLTNKYNFDGMKFSHCHIGLFQTVSNIITYPLS